MNEPVEDAVAHPQIDHAGVGVLLLAVEGVHGFIPFGVDERWMDIHTALVRQNRKAYNSQLVPSYLPG